MWRIRFDVDEQVVTSYCEISEHTMPASMLMQELKAINKKVEELRWI